MQVRRREFMLTQKVLLPSSGSVYLAGVTNGRQISFTGEEYTSNEGGFEVHLHRTPIFTGGTPMFPVNLNDTDLAVSSFTVLAAPTVTNEGTLMRVLGVP